MTKENMTDSPLPAESVWDYPRPPALEPVPQEVVVRFNGQEIARTTRAMRVLETSHPPVYYIPPADIQLDAIQPAAGGSWCEWKGRAVYFDVVVDGQTAGKAAWSYPNPTPGFESIRDHLAFYAQKMEACFVGEERVDPQDGSFYGGWITSNLKGPFKGGPGTLGW